MERPGCLQDELYRWEESMQKQLRELQRNEMTILLRIMALEKLVGATPVEVALATADPVFGLAVADMEPIRGRIHDVSQWEDAE